MSRLAVLIPVYRNQEGLTRTLESLREAAGGFDVFIVDDGSPEPLVAPKRLRENVAVRILRLQSNGGIARALNQGLRVILAGNYTFVARVDASDTILPERFPRQVRFLETHPDCAVVSSFVELVDAERKRLFLYRAPSEHAGIVRRMHLNNCLAHPGCTMRTEALAAVGLYCEDLSVTEDYELFLRMAKRYTLAVLPEVLTRCEYSRGGLSVARRRRQQRERLTLQWLYFDRRSPYSFLGVARTLAAMLVPHRAVFWWKRATG
ncbi:MAG TPA: glycosyltransferase [Bryobacteraceae bacterium]|nr:glycosyltransferase [Bryobacteraceae bacterium]